MARCKWLSSLGAFLLAASLVAQTPSPGRLTPNDLQVVDQIASSESDPKLAAYLRLAVQVARTGKISAAPDYDAGARSSILVDFSFRLKRNLAGQDELSKRAAEHDGAIVRLLSAVNPLFLTRGAVPAVGVSFPALSHVLDGSSGGLVIQRPQGKTISLNAEGTIDFWVAATWDPAQLPPDVSVIPLLALRSNSQTYFELGIGSAKDVVTMSNGPNALEYWQVKLGDGRMHHLALTTSAVGTELFVDGRSAGEKPIPYGQGDHKRMELTAGGKLFAGQIANVRLWRSRLKVTEIKELAALHVSEIARRSEYSSLAGVLTVPEFTGTRARFEVFDPVPSPEGVWQVDGFEATSRKQRTDFIFTPPNLLVIAKLPRGHAWLQLTQFVGSTALVGFDVPLGNLGAWVLEPHHLQGVGAGQFAGGGWDIKMRDQNTLTLNDRTYRRAERTEHRKAEYSDSFERTRQVFGIEFTERAYNVIAMDAWDYRNTGSNRRVFQHFREPLFDYDPTNDGWNVPRGLLYLQELTGVAQSDQMTSFSSQEYATALRFGAGITASFTGAVAEGSFAANAKFRSAVSSFNSEKNARTFGGKYCRKMTLILDRANARLHPQFLEAVEKLKQTHDYDGFVADFGTHYANAVTYGAKVLKEVKFNEKGAARMQDRGFDLEGTAKAGVGSEKIFKASLELSGSYGQDTKTGSNNSDIKETEYSMSIGYDGGSLEGFSCPAREVVPVFVDLRTLDELLLPPFTVDPELIASIRVGVQQAIRRSLEKAAQENRRILSSQRVFDPALIKAHKGQSETSTLGSPDGKLKIKLISALTPVGRGLKFTTAILFPTAVLQNGSIVSGEPRLNLPMNDLTQLSPDEKKYDFDSGSGSWLLGPGIDDEKKVKIVGRIVVIDKGAVAFTWNPSGSPLLVSSAGRTSTFTQAFTTPNGGTLGTTITLTYRIDRE